MLEYKGFDFENYLKELDYYRYFPKFQLERHADLIFKRFLPLILRELNFATEICEVIPEFPISNQLINPNCENQMAISMDFLAIGKKNNKNIAIFIELKTDNSSSNGPQDSALEKIHQKDDFLCLALKKLVEIYHKVPGNRRKYLALIFSLKKLGLLNFNPEWEKKVLEHKKCYKNLLPVFNSVNDKAEKFISQVVKIVPSIVPSKDTKKNEFVTISFDQISQIALKNGDKGSNDFEKFKKYLKKWATSPQKSIWDFLPNSKLIG